MVTRVSTTLDGLVFRDALTADAARLAEVFVEGFESYRGFASEGFRVPSADDIAHELAGRLGAPSVWCELAQAGEEVAGYVSLIPAAETRRPVDDPALAHFWMLFVRARWWGTGLATRLHAAAVDEARRRGFGSMRLFTPAEQARARRFYEREGWTLTVGPEYDPALGLEIVEYRRPL